MKFPGRIYEGEKWTYLAVYNFFPDLMTIPPPSVRENAVRMAHVSYGEGGKRRGIDIFKVDKTEVPEIGLSDTIVVKSIDKRDPKRTAIEVYETEVNIKQDVQYDLIRGAPDEVKILAGADIALYCREPAKKPIGTRIDYHDKIIPVTALRKIRPERVTTPGKQDFVPSCLLEANIDFSQGCVSGWIAGDGAKFDGENFTGFCLDPYSECWYCYAIPKHKSFPKTVYKIERQRLKDELLGKCKLTVGSDAPLGRPVRVLRFGKRTEAASEFTLDSLVMTLETCIETGTRTVLPTKFLKYNPEIAKLLRLTNSTLLYSIGFDELEPGPVSYGCTNKWREEQSIKYKHAGVNTSRYLLIVAHKAAEDRERKVVEDAIKNGMTVQLLPMRFNSKILANNVTGNTWLELKSAPQPEFDGRDISHQGTYEYESGNLKPKWIHPDYLKMVESNSGLIRMCHHSSKETYCGTCFLAQKGIITKTPPRAWEPVGGRFKKKPKGPRLPFPEDEADYN